MDHIFLSNPNDQRIFHRYHLKPSKYNIVMDRNYLQMALLNLPNEVLQAISRNLESHRDMNALAQTNRQFHCLFNPYLYPSNIRHQNSSAMIRAAEHGQLRTAKNLIREGVDVQSLTNFGIIPLSLAVFNGHEALVRLPLAHGAKPEQEGLFGRTPLHEAARSGREAIVRLLIAKGVDLEPIDSDGQTPLHAAACAGHQAVTKFFLEGDVYLQSMDSKDLLGCTPLLHAARGGYEAVAMQLIAAGADLDSQDSNGRTSLHLATSWLDQLNISSA